MTQFKFHIKVYIQQSTIAIDIPHTLLQKASQPALSIHYKRVQFIVPKINTHYGFNVIYTFAVNHSCIITLYSVFV